MDLAEALRQAGEGRVEASFALFADTLDPAWIDRALNQVLGWLNQIEIYFSIVQRKVLMPNDFTSLAAVEDRLLRFQEYNRTDLAIFLNKMEAARTPLRPSA